MYSSGLSAAYRSTDKTGGLFNPDSSPPMVPFSTCFSIPSAVEVEASCYEQAWRC